MFAFRSIRLRLTLWYVLVLALILAGFSAGVYLTLRHNLYSGLDDSLETRSNDLQSLISSEGGAPTLAASLPSSRVDPGEQFVRVFNVSGQATFEDSATPAPVNRQSIDRALAGRAHTREASIDGEPFRILSSPIERDGQIIGVLEVGRATDDVRDTLNSLLLILLISYPATLVVASFAGMFLAGRALSPIDRLTRMAQRISAEDLSQRLDLRLPDDEIGRLARTFDEMIARLEGSFLRQRQFTADASHELRTPLAAIKGQVEVALSRPRNQVHYQEVLHAVNEEIDRLIRLVGSLLT
ncbi:MAG TPA: histidine kinase dimerization/phospho-acceptor domain-containing protein, partial [Dehalococcoidia bacterium]|nr:histidine kinase dimerization/phospho-acceptor domain-containing protein [Dehalococcoidia bacterium]